MFITKYEQLYIHFNGIKYLKTFFIHIGNEKHASKKLIDSSICVVYILLNFEVDF